MESCCRFLVSLVSKLFLSVPLQPSVLALVPCFSGIPGVLKIPSALQPIFQTLLVSNRADRVNGNECDLREKEGL